MEKETSSALFPLSVNVLPGAYLPLQIFEPRYIDMVSCLLYTSPSPRDVEESGKAGCW